ncbi:MAG: YlmH/Sll1252 family protein [Oscillospiraceae bacterium]
MRGYIPPQNTQETIFVKRASELLQKAEDYYTIQYSAFLDLRQKELFKAQSNRYTDIEVSFECGYDGAGERCLAVVRPFSFPIEEKDIPIVVLTSKLYENNITHRDLLGAIMNLKITRDYIGDIIADQECAYLVVHSNVSEIIIQELKQVKNSAVEFSVYKNRLSCIEKTADLKSATVASMRIDAIIAALLQISRSEGLKLIKQGRVKVNQLEVCSADFEMFDGDIISVKQIGKYKIFCDGNKSRKDRMFINFAKY